MDVFAPSGDIRVVVRSRSDRRMDVPANVCVHTRACAVWGYFVFLLYSSLNVCSTVKFDGSYYDDKVIWTGLCSRTLLKRV